LPRGRQLVTLQDAGNYITKLPKAEHEAEEWQAAMEVLILARRSVSRRGDAAEIVVPEALVRSQNMD
jgi:hypothetical protein